MYQRPVDEADAYELLERLRWGGPPTSCPHCGAVGSAYFLQPQTAAGRRTRTGAGTGRRVWKCAACRQQFSVLAGTILQGTRIGLCTWVAVMADRERGPVGPADVADRHRIGPEAARRMLRRLELADTIRAGDDGPGGALGAVLQLPGAAAEQIRRQTPTRARPRRQTGPSADYGSRSH